MDFDRDLLLNGLREVGGRLQLPAEITIVGGAAGMITKQFPSNRITIDCDVISYVPERIRDVVEAAAHEIAVRHDWPADWLNSKVMGLNILPAGWRSRRLHVATFGCLTTYALGRLDLLATKFYATRPQDRADIRSMAPTVDELYFIRRYLEQMRLPFRGADLDRLQVALEYLKVIEREHENE
jgi:hypothetical protein